MPYADKNRQRAYQLNWLLRRRGEYLAGKMCVWCGSTDHLEFHHIDPATKDTHRIWSWQWERLQAELTKCIILCRHCHRSYHAQVNNPRHVARATIP